MDEYSAPKTMEKIKILEAVLKLPAKQLPIWPIYQEIGQNGLNWQCCLAGSSKTVDGRNSLLLDLQCARKIIPNQSQLGIALKKSSPLPPLCCQMDFMQTFEGNAKRNNINHV